MPTTCSKTHRSMKEPSPAWKCESGELPKEPTPTIISATPSVEPVQTVTPTPPLSTPEPSPAPLETSRQARNARNSRWLPWQDRFLASEALKLRPFLETRGTPIQEAWDRLAEEMRQDSSQKGTVIDCTGSACHVRFKLIIEAHKKSETRSLQKTGTDEQVDDHILTLTNLVALLDEHNTKKEHKLNEVKTRTNVESQAALELRDAAMKGVVKQQGLTDITQLDGSTMREKQGQHRKRPCSPSPSPSAKENQGGHPRKRRSRNVLFDVLEERVDSDSKLLQSACARDEHRQAEIVDQLDRMVDGISDLAKVTKESMERNREQQMDMMKIMLEAVIKKM